MRNYLQMNVEQIVTEINRRAVLENHRASRLDRMLDTEPQEICGIVAEVRREVAVLWNENPPLTREQSTRLTLAKLLLELLP